MSVPAPATITLFARCPPRGFVALPAQGRIDFAHPLRDEPREAMDAHGNAVAPRPTREAAI